ncbi:MAG: hypothetical protein WC382_03360 [Methanoregulaceae archaeon]|jgi:hypothetical protein
MDRGIIFISLSIFLTLFTSGCISDFTPSMNTSPQVTTDGDIPVPQATPTATAQKIEVPGPGTSNYTIPVLLTDLDWKLANGCGWTEDNLSQSASLFMDDCRIQQLLRDGWEITGIGYDMYLIGSRCRRSTHPDANESCDWCLDAGPTLFLSFQGITTVYLANLNEKKVIHYIADTQGNSFVYYKGGSEIIIVRNGIVLYTFRGC